MTSSTEFRFGECLRFMRQTIFLKGTPVAVAMEW